MPEKKKEHPQAKWLRAIADGTPLQWGQLNGQWVDMAEHAVLSALLGGDTSRIRIKPRTITIGKYEVAEPMREAPERDTQYFCIAPSYGTCVDSGQWEGFAAQHNQIKSGMCWLKREDAELAAKAISELLTGK